MKLTLRFKGGAGSGHHGHSGRPGKRGGSAAGSGGSGSGGFENLEHALNEMSLINGMRVPKDRIRTYVEELPKTERDKAEKFITSIRGQKLSDVLSRDDLPDHEGVLAEWDDFVKDLPSVDILAGVAEATFVELWEDKMRPRSGATEAINIFNDAFNALL